MIKQAFYILWLLFMTVRLQSQQMPLYSQYMLNGFTFNSAMAGHNGLTTVNAVSRQQWLGLDNAPRSFSFSAQTRILMRSYMIKSDVIRGNKFIRARKGRVGLGINLYNDRNGYFDQSGLNLSYAYHLSFNNSQLSFGLAASVTQFKINSSGISFRNDDIKFSQVGDPIYVPDANAGVFFERLEWYAGVSVSNMMQSKVKFGNPNLQSYELKRHYYGILGYRYTEIHRYVYEPTILIKTTEALTPQIDVSLKVEYNENYWFGFSYRTLNSAVVFMGIVKNNFSAGYAFDYDFNAFQRFTYGSHELNLALKFGDSAKRYRWIKRF